MRRVLRLYRFEIYGFRRSFAQIQILGIFDPRLAGFQDRRRRKSLRLEKAQERLAVVHPLMVPSTYQEELEAL